MMKDLGGFLERLKTFDAEGMDDHLVNKLKPVTENPVMDFDVMNKKSKAAANLSNWVCNVYRYNRIYVKVKPLWLIADVFSSYNVSTTSMGALFWTA